jgi:hypothetical protein
MTCMGPNSSTIEILKLLPMEISLEWAFQGVRSLQERRTEAAAFSLDLPDLFSHRTSVRLVVGFGTTTTNSSFHCTEITKEDKQDSMVSPLTSHDAFIQDQKRPIFLSFFFCLGPVPPSQKARLRPLRGQVSLVGRTRSVRPRFVPLALSLLETSLF